MPGRELYNFSIGSLATCIRHLRCLNSRQKESDLNLIKMIKQEVNHVFSDAISRVSDEKFFRENVCEISDRCFTHLSINNEENPGIDSQNFLPTFLGRTSIWYIITFKYI